MNSNLNEIVRLLADTGSLQERAMSGERFFLCNLIKQIEEREILDEAFFLLRLESALLTFCRYLEENKDMIPSSIELGKFLYSDFSLVDLCELKEKLKEIMEGDSKIVSEPVIVKILR